MVYNAKKNVKGSFAVKVSSVHGERFQELHGTMRIERPWEGAEGRRFPFFSVEVLISILGPAPDL